VLKSWCLLYLPQRAEHVKDEEWDKTNRSDSQARQTNEYHNELTTLATAFEYEMPRHGCALELAPNPIPRGGQFRSHGSCWDARHWISPGKGTSRRSLPYRRQTGS